MPRVHKCRVGCEVPLKSDKPMIMDDDDMRHFKAMFTECKERFNTAYEACSCVLQSAFFTDLHIDLTHPKSYATHIKPYAEFSIYVEYEVYNASTGFKYDAVVRIGKHPDGKYSVDFCRASDKVKE